LWNTPLTENRAVKKGPDKMPGQIPIMGMSIKGVCPILDIPILVAQNSFTKIEGIPIFGEAPLSLKPGGSSENLHFPHVLGKREDETPILGVDYTRKYSD
jgi:hypothetical protein